MTGNKLLSSPHDPHPGEESNIIARCFIDTWSCKDNGRDRLTWSPKGKR